MSSISIERIQLKDSPKLRILARKSFHAAYSANSTEEQLTAYIDDAFTLEKIESMICHEKTAYFVAVLEGEFIGYTKLRWDRSLKDMLDAQAFEGKLIDIEAPIEMQRLYLLPEFYGKKLGILLLNTAVYFSSQQGFKYMWLSVWFKNYWAIRFYEKHDFEQHGHHIFIFADKKEKDFFMVRQLK